MKRRSSISRNEQRTQREANGKRRRKATKKTNPDNNNNTTDNVSTRGTAKTKADTKPSAARVVGNFNRNKPITDQQKSNYVKFLNETFTTGVQGIIDQYHQVLKTYIPPNSTRVAFDQNPEKNRYKDVVCGDNARVVLKDNHPNGPYIHANFVSGEPLVNTFICTQGPMPSTCIDFWRMIVQEHVENIFMLCETEEQGQQKCEPYWPREKGKTMEFSGVVVKNVEIDTSDSTTIMCVLEVTTKSEKFTLKHHQWRTWPDKSVPQSVMAPFRLLKLARWSASPTIIHCSAGIGRTGTVAVLELCLQMLLTCRPLTVVNAIQHLRTMRLHAVQTDLQFLYVHKCLIAYATAAGLIKDDLIKRAAQFDQDYNELLKKYARKAQEFYSPFTPAQGFGGGGGPPPPNNSTPPAPSASQGATDPPPKADTPKGDTPKEDQPKAETPKADQPKASPFFIV